MRTLLVLAALAATFVLVSPAGAAVKRLEANMSGVQETDRGDPNGSGTAKLRLDRAERTVCFTIRVRRIGAIAAAHIHRGGRGVAGDIEVELIGDTTSRRRVTGCTEDVTRSLIREMLRRPRRFYVNVHTGAFPAGAIRGQLRKPD